jgi:hypothetical protein
MATTRLIIWDLSFTAKGYIWPAVKTGEVIRQSNTNLYFANTNLNNSIKTSTITITPDPANADPDDEFGFSETIVIYPNTVANT